MIMCPVISHFTRRCYLPAWSSHDPSCISTRGSDASYERALTHADIAWSLTVISAASSGGGELSCDLCGVKVSGSRNMAQHLSSARHLRRAAGAARSVAAAASAAAGDLPAVPSGPPQLPIGGYCQQVSDAGMDHRHCLALLHAGVRQFANAESEAHAGLHRCCSTGMEVDQLLQQELQSVRPTGLPQQYPCSQCPQHNAQELTEDVDQSAAALLQQLLAWQDRARATRDARSAQRVTGKKRLVSGLRCLSCQPRHHHHRLWSCTHLRAWQVRWFILHVRTSRHHQIASLHGAVSSRASKLMAKTARFDPHREVAKWVRMGKARAVLVAPNIEPAEGEAGLTALLQVGILLRA